MTDIDFDVFTRRLMNCVARLVERDGADSIDEYSEATMSVIDAVAARLAEGWTPTPVDEVKQAGQDTLPPEKMAAILDNVTTKITSIRHSLNAQGRNDESIAHEDALAIYLEMLREEMGIDSEDGPITPELAEYRERHGL